MTGLKFNLPQLKAPAVRRTRKYDGTSERIVFNHSGNMGDIIFSLYFVREFIACKKIKDAEYHIRINRPPPTCSGRITDDD